jgi:hypothetical protein
MNDRFPFPIRATEAAGIAQHRGASTGWAHGYRKPIDYFSEKLTANLIF